MRSAKSMAERLSPPLWRTASPLPGGRSLSVDERLCGDSVRRGSGAPAVSSPLRGNVSVSSSRATALSRSATTTPARKVDTTAATPGTLDRARTVGGGLNGSGRGGDSSRLVSDHNLGHNAAVHLMPMQDESAAKGSGGASGGRSRFGLLGRALRVGRGKPSSPKPGRKLTKNNSAQLSARAEAANYAGLGVGAGGRNGAAGIGIGGGGGGSGDADTPSYALGADTEPGTSSRTSARNGKSPAPRRKEGRADSSEEAPQMAQRDPLATAAFAGPPRDLESF